MNDEVTHSHSRLTLEDLASVAFYANRRVEFRFARERPVHVLHEGEWRCHPANALVSE